MITRGARTVQVHEQLIRQNNRSRKMAIKNYKTRHRWTLAPEKNRRVARPRKAMGKKANFDANSESVALARAELNHASGRAL